MVDTDMNKSASPLRNPLCVALDVDEQSRALEIMQPIADLVGGVKIGPRLIHRYGEQIVKKMQNTPVFVDCKFFDIESTMEAAVKSCFEAGARLVTVHALAGLPALRKMAQIQQQYSTADRPCRILAVTVLTSWTEQTLPTNMKAISLSEHVLQLSRLVLDSGLNSLVCSGHELKLLREHCSQDTYLLVPGIRMPDEASGDQSRVMGPEQALVNGANAIVVGRPIVAAENPEMAVKKYLKQIS